VSRHDIQPAVGRVAAATSTARAATVDHEQVFNTALASQEGAAHALVVLFGSLVTKRPPSPPPQPGADVNSRYVVYRRRNVSDI
jgi:hypothetical protein